MNYKQLTPEMKVRIDVLLEEGYSMRGVGRKLSISHSTVSRYVNKVYKKRVIDIKEKYKDFISYIYDNYDWKVFSIGICVHTFQKKISVQVSSDSSTSLQLDK